MSGYEEFQQIMAEINRKKLPQKNGEDLFNSLFGGIFGNNSF